MGSPTNSPEYILAQKRLADFKANTPNLDAALDGITDFTDYDVYLVSGIVEGLNERRRFIKNGQVITRCTFNTAGLIDKTSQDLAWEIDLVEDILKPSIAGDGESYVGGEFNDFVQSGTLLSMRLLNMIRYHVIETSMGCLSTRNNFLLAASGTYELGRILLPPTLDNRIFGQMYRTFNTNTDRHYPCANGGGSIDQNGRANTRTNSVDAYANPASGSDPTQTSHPTFYDEAGDLQNFNASGYPGNGDIELLRAIKTSNTSKINWPVQNFQGQLVKPKTISSFNSETYPSDDSTWQLWTNKTELFDFEADFYNANGIASDFFFNNEYLSSKFPVTANPSGNAFLSIREHFLEIITAIEHLKYFGVLINHTTAVPNANPLTTDTTSISAQGASKFDGCIYNASPCGGGTHSICTAGGGPPCCSQYPQTYDGLCNDCGIALCASYGCVAPSVTSSQTTTGLFINDFPGVVPDPLYYTASADSSEDTQGIIFGGCPILSLRGTSKARMRTKRIVYDYAFTGTLIISYKTLTTQSDIFNGFGLNGHSNSTQSSTLYNNQEYAFPISASTLGLNGATEPDFTNNSSSAAFGNCTNTCIPSPGFGGASQNKDYRQYPGFIAVAVPTFIMIPANASLS